MKKIAASLTGVLLIAMNTFALQAAETDMLSAQLSGSKAWVTDTLFPSLEGDFFGGWNSNFRVEYEATKLTPAYPCSVLAIVHGVFSPTAGITKQCSIFVWSDSVGFPKTVLFKAQVTAVADSANRVVLDVYPVTPVLYFSGPFWVGNYEMDTLFPTSVIDSVAGNSKYNSGSGWITDEADYVHGAFLKYNNVSEEENNISQQLITLKTSPSLFSKNISIFYSISGNNKDVQIDIYDIKGALVKQLVNGKHNAGNYTVCWNGCDKTNNPLGSGVYFCHLTSEDQKIINKMIFLK
ncbi:MAG: FlgD immunoglobulin-like domain containing protein [bacterium]|nr:FlgD immunoglobulin-like domain containing protein [bacterium]